MKLRRTIWTVYVATMVTVLGVGASVPLSSSVSARCAWALTEAVPEPTLLQRLAEAPSSLLPWGLDLGAALPRECRAASLAWMPHDCVSAEFSAPLPAAPTTVVLALAKPADGCAAETKLASSIAAGGGGTMALLAARGGCSFEAKAALAQAAGVAVLVVADTAPGAVAMPMGGVLPCGGGGGGACSGAAAAAAAAAGPLTAVMVGAEAQAAELLAAARRGPICYTLGHDPAPACGEPPLPPQVDRDGTLSLPLLTVLAAGCWWSLGGAGCDGYDGFRGRATGAALLWCWLAGVTAVRLATALRSLEWDPAGPLSSPPPAWGDAWGGAARFDGDHGLGSGNDSSSLSNHRSHSSSKSSGSGGGSGTHGSAPVVSWDHRETDEVVLASLVASVQAAGLAAGYALPAGLVKALRLAPENYAFSLFHHPPGFVALAAALGHRRLAPLGLRLTLPAVPVCLGAATTLVTVRCAGGLLGLGVGGRLAAGLVHSLCPLGWLCSQKVWLDNALAFAVAAAFAASAPALGLGQGEDEDEDEEDEGHAAKPQSPRRRRRRGASPTARAAFGGGGKARGSGSSSAMRWRCGGAAGLWLGLALWCKCTAALAAPALAALALAPSQRRRRQLGGGSREEDSWRARLPPAVAAASTSALVYAPWPAW